MTRLIISPSGWIYQSEQENWDEVDCWWCGTHLNDDYQIVNDHEGYAYHPVCLQERYKED